MQSLVDLRFELCFGNSTDVGFSFKLDQFPDLFLSMAMQKVVLAEQGEKCSTAGTASGPQVF